MSIHWSITRAADWVIRLQEDNKTDLDKEELISLFTEWVEQSKKDKPKKSPEETKPAHVKGASNAHETKKSKDDIRFVSTPISSLSKTEKQRLSGKPCSRTDYIEQHKRNEHILHNNMFWCCDDAPENRSKVDDKRCAKGLFIQALVEDLFVAQFLS